MTWKPMADPSRKKVLQEGKSGVTTLMLNRSIENKHILGVRSMIVTREQRQGAKICRPIQHEGSRRSGCKNATETTLEALSHALCVFTLPHFICVRIVPMADFF